MSLRVQAIKGVGWTGISTVIVSILQILQLAILARFLDPADFGLMAILMVVIGFAQAFQDMGISSAIIQRQHITHQQLSSLYWLNIMAGIVLSVIIFFLSPIVAHIYDEPKISDMMSILSGVFVLVSIGNQYRVLCQKELDFRTMETINVTAALAAFAVAIVLAVNEFGVLAVVVAMLTQAGVASVLFLWVGLQKYHRPSLLYLHSEMRGFYGFGLYQVGDRLLNYIGTNADKLLIGKLVGIDATGFYNLAWQLIIFPVSKINPIVNKVAFPVYSKVQNNTADLNRYYSFNVKALSLVTMPLLAFLIFFPHEIVWVIFGEGWGATAELLPALALLGILRAVGNPGGAIVLALGRADVGFWWNLVWVATTVSGLAIGLVVSPTTKTAVHVLLGLSFTVGLVWHFIIARVAAVEYGAIARHFARLFFVVMVIGWLGLVFTDFVGLHHSLLRIVAGGITCALLYVTYLFIFESAMFHALKSKS